MLSEKLLKIKHMRLLVSLLLLIAVYTVAVFKGNDVKLPQNDFLTPNASLINSSVRDLIDGIKESKKNEFSNQDSTQLVVALGSIELDE